MTDATEPPSGRFADADDRKRHGTTYTPPRLASFLADQVVALLDERPRDRPLRLLDPAVGQGALLVALLDALTRAGFEQLHARGFDADGGAAHAAQTTLRARFASARIECTAADFLAECPAPDDRVDLVVANPPYVRTQVLGSQAARALAARFGLRGRIDIYQAFTLALTDWLADDGVAGLIVSNRFLTTRAGGSLREALPGRVRLQHIWDLGDTRLFDAAVLPALVVATGRAHPRMPTRAAFTSVYQGDGEPSSRATDVVDALAHDGVVELGDGRRVWVRHGELHVGAGQREVWRRTDATVERWLATVAAATARTLGELGRIRVGVKSTADPVFIRARWDGDNDVEPELLQPLLTHHAAGRYRADAPARQILYPHRCDDAGRCVPVDLDAFPRAAAYLERHRERMSSRRYVARAGRRWYEVWCPQDPSAWAHRKLVFRDIAERPTFWIDDTGAVVNGDCYWLVPDDGVHDDWLWLALAVANSTFCERFYDCRFNNRLYGKRRRFITQYMRHLPLPERTTAPARRAIELARERAVCDDAARAAGLEAQIDALVWDCLGGRPG